MHHVVVKRAVVALIILFVIAILVFTGIVTA